MIKLEELTKVYEGTEEPAVADLSMDVPEGEIVVLVGPSGCGKTTTMKMINRVIEPTSGRIFLEGEDVTSTNPDLLRRRIGYVIQQIGLFPHMSIRDNVATVPRLLDWDEHKIDDRVDELLELVGMDPGRFRGRYPRELSGGQRQRIGVIRALAADPPVMLMDEPFGAIDPITRERLQNEFLRLQADIKKTIVFVTHDIDEAIKMGDRIAILQDQSIIAQFDTPEEILTNPASQFVSDFVGSGAALKRMNLTRVGEVTLKDWPTARSDEKRDTLRNRLDDAEQDQLLLLDDDGRPRRWLHAQDLRTDDELTSVGEEVHGVISANSTIADALDQMLRSHYGTAVVVDDDDRYTGAVDMAVVLAAAEAMGQSAGADAQHRLADADVETTDEEQVSG
ncbi:MAG: betaine/proline/choline family ABC transporter ATP-binding protein [Actinobacteria bacterium]|nr:betaine/proline/choline family ABC transporter ATP-binding protein [Actinomycetota bacterium]